MSRWLLLASLLPLACRTAVYEPQAAQGQVDQGPRFRISQVSAVRSSGARFSNVDTVSVTLEGERLELVRAVFLNSAYDEGCGGLAVSPVHGQHELIARWVMEDRTFFRGPTTVDLELEQTEGDATARCIRLPLASDAPQGQLRLTGRREWFLAGRFSFEGTSSNVTSSVTSLSLASGTWLGPLRLSLATGIAESRSCAQTLCDTKKGQEPPTGLTLPIDVEAEAFLLTRHTSAVSLGLRPGMRLTWFKTLPEPKRRTAFTPALVLKYWLRYELPLSSLATPRRAEGNGAALEVPLGLWQDLEGAQPLGWYTGLSFSMSFSVD